MNQQRRERHHKDKQTKSTFLDLVAGIIQLVIAVFAIVSQKQLADFQTSKFDDDKAWKKGIHEDVLVWIALLIFLGITFAVSLAPWGIWSSIISFTVSGAKTALIAYFYMHLKREKGMTRIFALGGITWLMILVSLTLSDYTTRRWLPYPSRWPIFVRLRQALHEGAVPVTGK